jgi:hypothetical protein
MVPVDAPPKVYRFVGKYPVEQVRDYVNNRVVAKKTKTEGVRTYLFREAKVKEPAGKSSGKEVLAVRVFQTPKGKAVIDIWLERDYKLGQVPDKQIGDEHKRPNPALKSFGRQEGIGNNILNTRKSGLL